MRGNWKYEGRTKDGKRIKGIEEAETEKELRKVLRSKGIRPVKMSPPSILEMDLGMWMVDKGIAKPFGTAELTSFTRQLAVMINAGVPILQSHPQPDGAGKCRTGNRHHTRTAFRRRGPSPGRIGRSHGPFPSPIVGR